MYTPYPTASIFYMKSGVYCLTFKDGSQYVGKSIDIERRWKEHAEKFKNGKAAKNMQAAYEKYGYPNAKVLIECHVDHIDLMETYYICRLQPQLNAIGGIFVSDTDLPVLEKYHRMLAFSTVEHIKELVRLYAVVDSHNTELDAKDKKYSELKEYLDEAKMETELGLELNAMEYKFKELEQMYEEAEAKIELMQLDLDKPWWKRIFS